MARNNVQTTVTVGMDVQLAKRNAEALKEVVASLKKELKEQRAIMDAPLNVEAYQKASVAVDKLILKIRTLEKVQKSATPASAYESYISGDAMNSNTLRQAQRGAKNRLNTVRTDEGDAAARQFINDTNAIQKQLNRLQAGFTSPFRTIKQELNQLSGGELQRLHQLLQQEQPLVKGNVKAWSNYSAAIAKVEERMREYDTAARQQAGAATLSKAQSGGFATANERDIQRAIDKLHEYRSVINDPNGSGKGTYKATNAEIQKLQSNLDILKQKALEASGQGMTFATALHTGLQTLHGSFKGTTQQLMQAKQALEANLLTARKGSAEYDNIRRALNGIELELKKTGELSKEVHAVLNSPKGRSFNELKQAVEQGRQALANMRTTTKAEKKDFDELAAKVKAADIEMRNLGSSSKGTATAFDKAWSRLKTYIGLYVGAAVAMRKIVATLGDLMELSDKMGEVRKTTGFTADEVGRLTTELKKLDTRTQIQELLGLSAAAGQLGLKSQREIQGFTEAANQLIVALPEMGRESATTLMKIANATGDLEKNNNNVRETMERIGSTIIALRANSASAAPAITDFVSRIGAVGAQAGISIDQIAALGSTIDALGGRVEMSATALSRMIPAIRNNAFGVANAIGVTEKSLTDLFNSGRAMEAMVLIFQKMRDSVKQFDTSTDEGMNGMADNVEALLGRNAAMGEVMKELNQQGARAGIVFGLLSQNVDELEKQLGIASNAYRENTALMNEYNNMNETTAAKWARLKNQVEEFFVGDAAQRRLGGFIDALRSLVNLLTGNVVPALDLIGIALKTLMLRWAFLKFGIGEALLVSFPKSIATLKTVAVTAFSTIGTQIKAATFYLGVHTVATKRAAVEMRKLNAAQMANFWVALAAAIIYAGKALYDWKQRLDRTVGALADAEANITTTTREAGMLFSKFTRLTKQQNELTQSTKSLKDNEAKLSAELEELRNKLGEGAEQSDKFRRKQEELEDAHKKVIEAEGKASDATSRRLMLVKEINEKYSSYLGYMLSEASTAETVASAHDLIISALKEEMYWREQNNAFETVTEQHSKKLKSYRNSSLAELNGMDVMRQQNIMSEWQSMLSSVTYDAKAGGFVIPGAEKAFSSIEDAMNTMKNRFDMVLSNEGGYYMVNPADRNKRLNDLWGNSGAGGWGSWTRWADRGFKDWTRESLEVLKEAATLQNMSGSAAQRAHDTSMQKAIENTNALIKQAQQRDGNVTNRQLAEAVVGIEKNLSKYGEIAGRYTQFGSDTSLAGIANVLLKDLPAETRKAVENEIQRVASIGTTPGPKPKGTNPYGNHNPVLSPYEDWNADALVARRKEMLVRVRALANGADVQAVLSEDAKFITEATRNNIKTTRDAIEWYNNERLKIQEALHEKHLTNSGDWMDPKKGRKRKPQFYESDYALAELDRYYSHRKELLEKAREEENMTEELFNREVELLEQEHLAKRSKLRETFTSKDKDVIEQFRQWWARLAETGDLAEVPWATVESEWAKTTDAQWGANNRKAQEDLTKLREITVKHLNAIAKIIDKERPYDSITANLRDNLTKMDILFADYQKNGPTEDTSVLVRAGTERLKFLLDEAESAYTSTVEDVLRRMGEAGMTAWAEEIRKSSAMQNALMAQLQTAYDEIQNAIKKEATLIRKQTDIWWNDIAKGETQSRKGVFEKAISDMGLLGDQVKRANSLIGAGQASERVADKLAIKQMQLRLQMQQVYYDQMRKMWADRIASLRAQGKEIDAQHAEMSRNLSLAEEQKKLDEQRVAIANRLEESSNRLYTELKSWANLLSSSLQSVFEASNAGNAEYYNELAKLNLTGKGGPGGGRYVVIDNAGTSGATAHYEYLDERQALERQHEIEQQNAVADAWKKVMDDINMKMSETITDQMNAMLQNASIDANTDAVSANTKALLGLTERLSGGIGSAPGIDTSWASKQGLEGSAGGPNPSVEFGPLEHNGYDDGQSLPRAYMKRMGLPVDDNPYDHTQGDGSVSSAEQVKMDADDAYTQKVIENAEKRQKAENDNNKKMTASAQSAFAKMSQAANLYGIAYQTMSNDNMSASQKFGMIAIQAAGNAAITALTANMSQATGDAAINSASVWGKLWNQLGWWAIPVYALFTGTLGGLMGLAASKIAKSKSEIAQATGASNSVASGRLTTGMLTYAEGNVNEFTDPATLTPGRQYNVDAADGRTYRARYMGRNPKTHLTNGPEFHLSGERGREMIIDAGTTRQITMNEAEIWHAIQTLSGGGRIAATRRRGRGMSAFAEGNLGEFEVSDDIASYGAGMSQEQAAALQQSIDRQSELLERALTDGIKGVFSVYGKDGLVDSYDRGKKTLNRYGQKY